MGTIPTGSMVEEQPFGDVFQSEGRYHSAPGYGSGLAASLSGFAAGPIVGAATTALKIGASIFEYYANKKREREERKRQEELYREQLAESKRRFDLQLEQQSEGNRLKKIELADRMRSNALSRLDEIDKQNYSRYQDLQSNMNDMLNKGSLGNRWQQTWGRG
jgi:hypothetical protein